MPSPAQKNHWAMMGLKYGYPHCCIMAFCNLDHIKDKTPRQLEGTGYVPCDVCNSRYGLVQLISHINQNRDKSLMQFPNEEMK